MLLVGVTTTILVDGSLPVLIATLGSAFVFSEFENRYKLHIGWRGHAANAVTRAGIAVLWTGMLYIAKRYHFG